MVILSIGCVGLVKFVGVWCWLLLSMPYLGVGIYLIQYLALLLILGMFCIGISLFIIKVSGAFYYRHKDLGNLALEAFIEVNDYSAKSGGFFSA